jgi:uncharacterized membrane protein YeiH
MKMSKADYVALIIAGVFNIAAVVVKACGLPAVSDVLYEVMPFVDTVVLAVFGVMGYTRSKARKKQP